MCSPYLMTYFRHVRTTHLHYINLEREKEREKARIMKSRTHVWNSCLLLEIARGERWDDERKRASLLRSLTREFNTGERGRENEWKGRKGNVPYLSAFSLSLSLCLYTRWEIQNDSRHGTANKSSVLCTFDLDSSRSLLSFRVESGFRNGTKRLERNCTCQLSHQLDF